jgi:hypothetical protein
MEGRTTWDQQGEGLGGKLELMPDGFMGSGGKNKEVLQRKPYGAEGGIFHTIESYAP